MTDDGRQLFEADDICLNTLPIIGILFIDYVSLYMRNIQPIAIMTIVLL